MEAHVTPAGRSVLDDLCLDAGYIVKAKLALRIQKTIAEMGLTQREAAARMPITQPRSRPCGTAWRTRPPGRAGPRPPASRPCRLVLFILLEPYGIYGRWRKVRLFFEIFPLYRRATFKRQRGYLKTERMR